MVFGIEHVLILAVLLITLAISSTPPEVSNERSRQRYVCNMYEITPCNTYIVTLKLMSLMDNLRALITPIICICM